MKYKTQRNITKKSGRAIVPSFCDSLVFAYYFHSLQYQSEYLCTRNDNFGIKGTTRLTKDAKLILRFSEFFSYHEVYPDKSKIRTHYQFTP